MPSNQESSQITQKQKSLQTLWLKKQEKMCWDSIMDNSSLYSQREHILKRYASEKEAYFTTNSSLALAYASTSLLQALDIQDAEAATFYIDKLLLLCKQRFGNEAKVSEFIYDKLYSSFLDMSNPFCQEFFNKLCTLCSTSHLSSVLTTFCKNDYDARQIIKENFTNSLSLQKVYPPDMSQKLEALITHLRSRSPSDKMRFKIEQLNAQIKLFINNSISAQELCSHLEKNPDAISHICSNARAVNDRVSFFDSSEPGYNIYEKTILQDACNQTYPLVLSIFSNIDNIPIFAAYFNKITKNDKYSIASCFFHLFPKDAEKTFFSKGLRFPSEKQIQNLLTMLQKESNYQSDLSATSILAVSSQQQLAWFLFIQMAYAYIDQPYPSDGISMPHFTKLLESLVSSKNDTATSILALLGVIPYNKLECFLNIHPNPNISLCDTVLNDASPLDSSRVDINICALAKKTLLYCTEIYKNPQAQQNNIFSITSIILKQPSKNTAVDIEKVKTLIQRYIIDLELGDNLLFDNKNSIKNKI